MTLWRVLEDRRTMRVLAVIACGTLLFVAVHTVGVSSAVNAQREAVARQDCARRVSAEQTGVRDRRDNVQAKVVQSLVNRLLLGQRIISDEALGQLNAELGSAVTRVDQMPNLAVAVERECPDA